MCGSMKLYVSAKAHIQVSSLCEYDTENHTETQSNTKNLQNKWITLKLFSKFQCDKDFLSNNS